MCAKCPLPWCKAMARLAHFFTQEAFSDADSYLPNTFRVPGSVLRIFYALFHPQKSTSPPFYRWGTKVKKPAQGHIKVRFGMQREACLTPKANIEMLHFATSRHSGYRQEQNNVPAQKPQGRLVPSQSFHTSEVSSLNRSRITPQSFVITNHGKVYKPKLFSGNEDNSNHSGYLIGSCAYISLKSRLASPNRLPRDSSLGLNLSKSKQQTQW